MAFTVKELGKLRFIGDSELLIVHDTWHEASENCLIEKLIERGTAVGFEPDDLDQAFWESYDYCAHCFDRSDPVPPGPYGGARSHRRGRAARGTKDLLRATRAGV
jgi:hypothetical protein